MTLQEQEDREQIQYLTEWKRRKEEKKQRKIRIRRDRSKNMQKDK